MDADGLLERRTTAEALLRLAAELLAKAHEVDGKGFGAPIKTRQPDRRPH